MTCFDAFKKSRKERGAGYTVSVVGCVCVCARALVCELGPQVISIGQHTAYILYINIPKHDCTCTHTHIGSSQSHSIISMFLGFACR